MIKWFKDIRAEISRANYLLLTIRQELKAQRITLEAQEKHLYKLRECVHSDQRSGSTMKTMGKYP